MPGKPTPNRFSKRALQTKEYPYPLKNRERLKYEGKYRPPDYFPPRRPKNIHQKKLMNAIGQENYLDLVRGLSEHDVNRLSYFPEFLQKLYSLNHGGPLLSESFRQVFKLYDQLEKESRRTPEGKPPFNKDTIGQLYICTRYAGAELMNDAAGAMGSYRLMEIVRTTRPEEIRERLEHELESIEGAWQLLQGEKDPHDRYLWFQEIREQGDYLNKHPQVCVPLMHAAGSFVHVLGWAREVGSMKALVRAAERFGVRTLNDIRQKHYLEGDTAFGAVVRSALRRPEGKVKKLTSPKKQDFGRKLP